MKAQIEEKINQIAGFIENLKPYNNKIGIYTGNAGIALFLFYYSRITKKEKYEKLGMEYLQASLQSLKPEDFLPYTYSCGLSGLCWVINHLVEREFISRNNLSIISGFDKFLCNIMIYDMEKYDNNDFINGGVGTAFYLLDRLSNPEAGKSLSKFIDILNEKKNVTQEGLYWDYEGDKKEEERIINIGLAHGMVGTTLFLLNAYKKNINKEVTKELLEGSVRFILNQEMHLPGRKSRFPTYSLREDGKRWEHIPESRLGWCYGDVGIANLVWQYSQEFQDKQTENKAMEILLALSGRKDLQDNMVINAGICHGTAGLALFFNRMFINTGLEQLKSTSAYWIEQTLLMAKYEDGYAGYKANLKYTSVDLIEGISGIALTLLTYLRKIDASWERALLLI